MIYLLLAIGNAALFYKASQMRHSPTMALTAFAVIFCSITFLFEVTR